MRAEGRLELERTVTDLVAGAAADGAIPDDVAVGALMIALHGTGSATDRQHWAEGATPSIKLIIADLRAGRPATLPPASASGCASSPC